MSSSSEDFDRHFGRRFRGFVENGIGPVNADEVAARVISRAGSQSMWLPAVSSAIGVVSVAAVLLIAVALRGIQPPAGSSSANPASQPAASETATTSLPPSVSPTPFEPVAWELTAVPSPSDHPSAVVLGASPDGSVLLFRDGDAYDHVFVEHSGTVGEIAVPGHEAGVPIGSRLSPDGSTVLLESSGQLCRYDVASGSIGGLPPVPDAVGISWFGFASNTSAVLVADNSSTPVHPTALWSLDLPSGVYARVGSRTDVLLAYPTTAGVIEVVDDSSNHDNSGWHLYLVGSDGTERPLLDASGAGFVAVSPDGRYVALSKDDAGSGGTWLFDSVSRETRRLSDRGMVRSFAPDGTQVAIEYPDAHVEAVGLDGQVMASLPAAHLTVWIGR